MAKERTFSIIKPDATRRNLTGKINAHIEASGLRIIAQKRLWLSRAQAEKFYEVHAARPFYNDLCTFMTSGPVIPVALERDGAVDRVNQRPRGDVAGRPLKPMEPVLFAHPSCLSSPGNRFKPRGASEHSDFHHHDTKSTKAAVARRAAESATPYHVVPLFREKLWAANRRHALRSPTSWWSLW